MRVRTGLGGLLGSGGERAPCRVEEEQKSFSGHQHFREPFTEPLISEMEDEEMLFVLSEQRWIAGVRRRRAVQ